MQSFIHAYFQYDECQFQRRWLDLANTVAVDAVHVGGDDNDDCGDEVEDDGQVMMLMEIMTRFSVCICIVGAEWRPTPHALQCDYFRRRRSTVYITG